ncbi:MAG: hypothetical protein Kapaf2KO_19220 [Candidatus Kapaibacteriales bacterium]
MLDNLNWDYILPIASLIAFAIGIFGETHKKTPTGNRPNGKGFILLLLALIICYGTFNLVFNTQTEKQNSQNARDTARIVYNRILSNTDIISETTKKLVDSLQGLRVNLLESRKAIYLYDSLVKVVENKESIDDISEFIDVSGLEMLPVKQLSSEFDFQDTGDTIFGGILLDATTRYQISSKSLRERKIKDLKNQIKKLNIKF